ncbi:VOC family protein [Streptomyces ovatisporus]|uniref:VOC family protein n=1 Tax=Streptomyces ovatisporus TaxID=1128682 RepID=A0ABV9A4Y9_9ACTN
MITTDFAAGAPCWLDLGVRDVSAAKKFYGGVFGWTLEQFGPGDDAYGLFKSDGKTVAALGPLDEGARSGWMIYFMSPDVDETAAKVRQLGGTVRVEPSDVDDQGRLAQFSDPQGGQFAAWQPGKTPGLETVDEPDSLMWVELYTTDSGAAKNFYKGLYGWQYSEMPVPDDPETTYVMITPAGEEQERMHGGLMQVPQDALALAGGDPFWHPVFRTNDCDATAAKVTELGGNVVMGPEDAEGVGRMAVCLDPFGADFVVLKPSM